MDILDNFDEKDRGPFLYWMINERTLALLHSHGRVPSALPCLSHFSVRMCVAAAVAM
jgi:hypothetical protein